MARFLGIVALALVLTTLAAGALVFQRRHELAEAYLRSRLEELGVEVRSPEVTRLGLSGVELRQLGLAGMLSVDRISARWSARSLLSGRLLHVDVSGVDLELDLERPDRGLPSRGSGNARPGDAPAVLAALPIGSARVEDLQLRARTAFGTVVAHAEAELRREDGRVDFDLDLCDASGHLAIRADGSFDAVSGAGEAGLVLDPVRFEPEGLQPRDLWAPAGEWASKVSGVIEARGDASFGGEELAGSLDLAFLDLALDLPGARIERLNGTLRLDPVWPPASPPQQLLAMASVDFGLVLRDGVIAYQLRPDGSVAIERAEWQFAGGRIRTAGRIDPAAEEQKLVLEVTDVALASLLDLSPLAGLSGEGRISGRLPLVRRGDVLEIRQGRLEGQPEGGRLWYRPASGAAATSTRVAGFEVMLPVLDDLHWQELRLELDGNTGEQVDIRLHIRGRNPSYQRGRPVEFNVNVESNLADLIRDAAVSYQLPADIGRRLAEKGFEKTRPKATAGSPDPGPIGCPPATREPDAASALRPPR